MNHHTMITQTLAYVLAVLATGVASSLSQSVATTKETHEWTGDTLTLFTSKDLTNWNERIIFKLTEADRAKVVKAQDVNNSDIDFCEYRGRLIINYSWGNQQGVEFLAEAEFDGTLEQFLTDWFPEAQK
jgi:hypothetical protein